MNLVSRREAKANNLKWYYTGKICKNGHMAERQTRNGNCRVCGITNVKKYAIKPEVELKKKIWSAISRSKSRESRSIDARNRKIYKLRRTPIWADLVKIKEIYKYSHYLSKTTGIKHHVDHIIPLKGKFVSGLHVHQNLQIIPAIDNMKKHNKFNIEEYNAKASR